MASRDLSSAPRSRYGLIALRESGTLIGWTRRPREEVPTDSRARPSSAERFSCCGFLFVFVVNTTIRRYDDTPHTRTRRAPAQAPHSPSQIHDYTYAHPHLPQHAAMHAHAWHAVL